MKTIIKKNTIYNSVMQHFPATSKETAIDIAIQGGANFQFYNK